ncbi:MAG: hypothetical protein HOI23_09690 [Deltaproteobacteria bacterium]|jgi:hypothetical protein|nr:hypothetical protein [Deltaproteobacteria bacterium]MBT6431974.1 hypothetical protein [Deltaproteobacteria bacterium]MBT6491783.1 hypothetical protein [Deltaproteobacteria bacterium]
MGQFDLVWLIWVGGGIAACVWLVGGFLFPAAGQWRDRERLIELMQLGPWVWGHCKVPGGTQRYRGTVWFGVLVLARRDFGKQHLLALGFNKVQAKSVEGQVMVRLKLKQEGETLKGNLWGTRFKFNPHTKEVVSVQATPAESREWVKSN